MAAYSINGLLKYSRPVSRVSMMQTHKYMWCSMIRVMVLAPGVSSHNETWYTDVQETCEWRQTVWCNSLMLLCRGIMPRIRVRQFEILKSDWWSKRKLVHVVYSVEWGGILSTTRNTIEERYWIMFTPQGPLEHFVYFFIFCARPTLKKLDKESWKPRDLKSLGSCSSVFAALGTPQPQGPSFINPSSSLWLVV